MQRLPLQRVGVLELVDQQVPDRRIEPLLHPAGEHRVGQHGERRVLDVVHVDPAALALERRKLRNQQPRQPRHALVVQPGFMLPAREGQFDRQFLRQADLLQAGQLVAELARLSLLRQQRGKHGVHIPAAQRPFEFRALGRKGPGRRAAERLRSASERPGLRSRARQQIAGLGETRELRKLLGPGLDRSIDHAMQVRQRKLHPLRQRGLKRLLRVEPAVRENTVLEVLPRLHIGGHRCVKAPPDPGHGRLVVFEQLIAGRQAEPVQHRERRIAQQRSEPAVKRPDLDRPAGSKQSRIEVAQGVALRGGRRGNPPVTQGLRELLRASRGKFLQPPMQPLAHLARGLFRECDRQDLLRLRALQQRPQDPRNQHPGLARPRARFHGDAAARVAGKRIELFTRDARAIALVGQADGDAHSQKSRRHRPRALQKSQAVPSPSAAMASPAAMRRMSSSTPAISASRVSVTPGWTTCLVSRSPRFR